MRKLTKVLSMCAPQPSWRIVEEWDRIISDTLGLKFKGETKATRYLKFNILNKYGLAPLINSLRRQGNIGIRFIMEASTKKSVFVNRNTIPVIIDFWLEDKDLPDFYEAYKDCPLVLITNKEVYDMLRAKGCPLIIEHWALSYPDQYAMKDELIEKEYEFCVFGRPNPFFMRLLDEYSAKHPDFSYIINNGDINNRQYMTNRGDFVAKDTGRNSYLDMISKTKISCYTTPGLDESKKITGSYNQVTPRLFELLCNQCFVVAHYPNTEDTQWYRLSDYVPNVDNYEQFEKCMNDYRNRNFDLNKYREFMSNHYSSKRAHTLTQLLKKHNIALN